jgi:hypothetical protein
MPGVKAANLPTVLFDAEKVGELYSLYKVDQLPLLRAVNHIGVTPEQSVQTSVNFTVFNSLMLGTNDGDDRFTRIMFRLPGLLTPAIDKEGLSRKQAGFKSKIAVNLRRLAIRNAINSLREEHGLQAAKIGKLSVGDVAGLILAHELHECMDRENGLAVRQERDFRARQYVTQCVDAGNRNPWKGVVILR